MKTHYQYYILEFPTCPKLLLWDWPVRISLSVHWQLQNIHAGCQNINMSWAGRKGTKHNNTQKKMELATHTQTVILVECVYCTLQLRAELPRLGIFLEPLYPASGWAIYTHTHIQARPLRLEPCGHAVNPWIRPFYVWRTAEGWSRLPLSACIPTRLTAACQNISVVSGKLCIRPVCVGCGTPHCFH